MNNKGQTLVIFVLLLPLIFLIMALVVESGRVILIKSDYENGIKETIDYGLNHLDDEDIKNKMNDLINANIDGNKKIKLENQQIEIEVTNHIEGLFTFILKDMYEIKFNYIGYIKDGKKIVKKR